MRVCHYCNTTGDLRPYGPRGSMVCFPCAMQTPERKKQTERNFEAQLNGCDGPAVLDGSEAGVYPAKHHPAARTIEAKLKERA